MLTRRWEQWRRNRDSCPRKILARGASRFGKETCQMEVTMYIIVDLGANISIFLQSPPFFSRAPLCQRRRYFLCPLILKTPSAAADTEQFPPSELSPEGV